MPINGKLVHYASSLNMGECHSLEDRAEWLDFPSALDQQTDGSSLLANNTFGVTWSGGTPISFLSCHPDSSAKLAQL